MGEKISVRKEKEQAEAAATAAAATTTDSMSDTAPVKAVQVGLKPLKAATKTTKKRFSSMIVLTGKNKQSYEQRRQEREQYKAMKAQEAELIEMEREEKAEERRRALQRKKQREENEKKGLIVQKITNTRKLKKMTKNQLNSIIKMDF